MGVTGVALLATVIGAPLVIGLEGAAIGTGLLSVAFKYVSRGLSRKALKHKSIQILGMAKLNTISDHTKQALADGVVSNEEFNLILSELEKYHVMKHQLQMKKRSSTNDQSLIEQGRREAMEMVRKAFDKN